MPSVRQFLTDAISDSKLVQPTQTPSGPQLDVARRKHADMVQAWSAVRLRLFFVPEVTYPLVGGKGIYEIGPGGADFDTGGAPPLYVKPVFIQSGAVIIGVARRWPLNILTRPQWEVIQTRGLIDPDGPLDLFYDFAEPKATFNVAPKPFGPMFMVLSQWNPLKAFNETEVDLNVEDFYPQYYVQAMRYGLAIELGAAYGLPVAQETLGMFQSNIGTLEKLNNDKLSGSFGFSRTLEGPTKGEGMPLQQQQVQGQ
jgi:hypothetical protein